MPDFPRRKDPESGFTVVELLVASGISVLVILGALTLIYKVVNPAARTAENLFDSISQDISLRTLDFQLRNSEIMRKSHGGRKLIECGSHTLLSPNPTFPAVETRSPVRLNEAGEGLGFAYTMARTFGTVASGSEGALHVPDPGQFQEGSVVLLSSLDAYRDPAFFTVTEVDKANHLLKLRSTVPAPSPAIGCRFNLGPASADYLNPLSRRKYAVESVAFLRMAVENDPQKAGEKKLIGTFWFGEGREGRVSLIERFVSLELNDRFERATETKGQYVADLRISYVRNDLTQASSGSATRQKETAELVYQAKYLLAGFEVVNEVAVPSSGKVEPTYVSCSVLATPLFDDFIQDSTGQPVQVYRLDVSFSEADTIRNAAPSFSAVWSEGSGGMECWSSHPACGSGTAACIRPRSASEAAVRRHRLMNAPFTESFSFEPIRPGHGNSFTHANSLTYPVYCKIPGAASLEVTLRYYDTFAKSLYTVACTPARLSGLDIEWEYDGSPSSCAGDGSVFLGALRHPTNPNLTGPTLRVAERGCLWTGSSTDSCNASEVRRLDPGARLKQVPLLPGGLRIRSGGTTLTCL